MKLHFNPVWAGLRQEPVILEARRNVALAGFGLAFEPESHTYCDTATGFIPDSVSAVVESFAAFDAPRKAHEICLRDHDNPLSKYFLMNEEQILAAWKKKADEAASRGTARHSFAEACFCVAVGLPDEVEDPWRERVSDDGRTISSESAGEDAVIRAWKWMPDTLVPVEKECRIYDRELGYAGTFDLLSYDFDTHGFALQDYKTNESLDKGHFGRMLPPFGNLWDTPLNHYALQQSLYKRVLIAYSIRVKVQRLLHVTIDGKFSPVEVADHRTTLEKVLAERKAAGLSAAGNIKELKR